METILQKSFFAVVGILGGYLANLWGGWDASLATLMIFMAIDYISGLVVAGVFKASPKSANGALESHAGFKGLCRKGMALFVVLIAAQLDRIIGSNFVRNAVIIAYMVNELLSIIENLGLMGVYVPKPLEKAVDVLKKRGE